AMSRDSKIVLTLDETLDQIVKTIDFTKGPDVIKRMLQKTYLVDGNDQIIGWDLFAYGYLLPDRVVPFTEYLCS
ncbi:MAG: hypothetical protein JSR33_12215, partial [Proteobacteria bacterium]|nr:hypothetical protein [Pseudomonadota bacterium]